MGPFCRCRPSSAGYPLYSACRIACHIPGMRSTSVIVSVRVLPAGRRFNAGVLGWHTHAGAIHSGIISDVRRKGVPFFILERGRGLVRTEKKTENTPARKIRNKTVTLASSKLKKNKIKLKTRLLEKKKNKTVPCSRPPGLCCSAESAAAR